MITASGGDDAIVVAEGHSATIDLLLTDVIMPGMLGRELAQRLVEVRPELRILFMSGYADSVLSSESGGLDLSMMLLEKPFTEMGLLERVRDVLDAPAPA